MPAAWRTATSVRARIGDERRAGVRDQRDRFAALQPRDQRRRLLRSLCSCRLVVRVEME